MTGEYGPHVLCYSQVANWCKEFRLGHESFVDEILRERPFEVITPDKIGAMENIII